jgi:uncharacterized protein YdbL (DUF1318 family)
MKILTKTILIFLMTFSLSVFASALTAPKSDGIIGERFDGYVGIVKDASPKIKALVKSVNQKRKEKYKEIAIKRQQALVKVEMIAGESAIKKTKPGNFIFLKNGGWKKK